MLVLGVPPHLLTTLVSSSPLKRSLPHYSFPIVMSSTFCYSPSLNGFLNHPYPTVPFLPFWSLGALQLEHTTLGSTHEREDTAIFILCLGYLT